MKFVPPDMKEGIEEIENRINKLEEELKKIKEDVECEKKFVEYGKEITFESRAKRVYLTIWKGDGSPNTRLLGHFIYREGYRIFINNDGVMRVINPEGINILTLFKAVKSGGKIPDNKIQVNFEELVEHKDLN